MTAVACAETRPRLDVSAKEAATRRELRVVELLLAHAPLVLGWFILARLATPREDRRGIDVVVMTRDLGEIHLQVKSSLTGVVEYATRALELGDELRMRAGIVIVKDWYRDDEVWRSVLIALEGARDRRERPPWKPGRTDGRRE